MRVAVVGFAGEIIAEEVWGEKQMCCLLQLWTVGFLPSGIIGIILVVIGIILAAAVVAMIILTKRSKK